MPPRTRFAALISRVRMEGLPWLVSAAFNRVFPARPTLRSAILAATRGGVGLEIGGPSAVFGRRGILPVYAVARRVDNVNFAPRTLWETELTEGGEFRFDRAKSPGRQFVSEATDLSRIADATYDFVLSSHCLEHVANPLAALQEWRRVMRPGGILVLILPDPRFTFDHRRPVTQLAHLRQDFERHTPESDLTHLDEILQRHDLRRDRWAGTPAEFMARARENHANRGLHHHVFDLKLVRDALTLADFEVCGAEAVRPLHLLAMARNPFTPARK